MGHPRRLQRRPRRSAPSTWGTLFRWTRSCRLPGAEVRHPPWQLCALLPCHTVPVSGTASCREAENIPDGAAALCRLSMWGALHLVHLPTDLHVHAFLGRACLDFCMSVLPVRPNMAGWRHSFWPCRTRRSPWVPAAQTHQCQQAGQALWPLSHTTPALNDPLIAAPHRVW